MTKVDAPQYPTDKRKVVRSFNDDGSANFGQVGIEELSYRARFGATTQSSTENDISIGSKYFVLNDSETKFRVGDDILIICLDDPDCYMWGEIIGSDTTYKPMRLLVYTDDVSDVTCTSSNWELQVVARPKPGIEKDTSTTSIDPTGAGPFTFTVTAGKFFPVGGRVLMKPTADRTIALIGEVNSYSGTSLEVYKNSTNATVSTSYTSWAISLLDSPSTSAVRAMSAVTPDSLGVPTVGTSNSVTNLSGGTFTLQSTWLFAHISDPSVWFEIEVTAVNGTTVTGLCLRKSGSGSKTGWTGVRTAPPKRLVDFNAKLGLVVTRSTVDTANDITVTAGTIRDSTDTINITLASAMTKRFDAVWAAGTNQGIYVLSSNLSGTIAQSASTAITGTSTLFTSEVYTTGFNKNSDWDARGTGTYFDSSVWGGTSAGYQLTTRSGSSTPVKFTAAASNTAATAAASATYSGETYKRGGDATLLASASGTVEFAVCVGYKSTTGDVDVFASTLNFTATPDYPSGYDYYAILALVKVGSGGIRTIRSAMLSSTWFSETKASTSGSTIDFNVDPRANEVIISFNGVSTGTATRDLRLQVLTASATPDTTAGDYIGFGTTNSTTPAATILSVASLIGTSGGNGAADTMSGTVVMTGVKEFTGAAVPFTSSWYSSSLAGNRGSISGYWKNATQLYGIRALISGSGSFDAGSITVSYR